MVQTLRYMVPLERMNRPYGNGALVRVIFRHLLGRGVQNPLYGASRFAGLVGLPFADLPEPTTEALHARYRRLRGAAGDASEELPGEPSLRLRGVRAHHFDRTARDVRRTLDGWLYR